MSSRPDRITRQNFSQYSCEDRGGWTLPHLRKFAHDLGILQTGNKDVVVARIRQTLNSAGGVPVGPGVSRSISPSVPIPVFAAPSNFSFPSNVPFPAAAPSNIPFPSNDPLAAFASLVAAASSNAPVPSNAPLFPPGNLVPSLPPSSVALPPSNVPSEQNPCYIFAQKPNSPEEIQKKRQIIGTHMHQKFGVAPNAVITMTNEHLFHMFNLYDELFFENRFRQHFQGCTDQLNLVFGRATSTAGQYVWEKKKDSKIYHTISMSKLVFSSVFTDPKRPIETINGFQTCNQLECLQIVFEHEIVHMMNHIWANEEIHSGQRRQIHGHLFKMLVRTIFGHTDYHDSIGQGLTENSEVHGARVKQYLRTGMNVQVHDRRVKDPVYYYVVKINKTRFIGRDHRDGKDYTVPMTSVILPTEDK